jgi:hypothetical protein
MFGKKSRKRDGALVRKQFERLGVADVDFHVEDELSGDSNPRLAPFVMFHEMWKGALADGDTQWISNTIEHFERRKGLTGAAAAMWPQNDPFAEALIALRDSGVDLRHITTVVRQAQSHLLAHVAYTLSDSHTDEPLFENVNWAVFETDDEHKPLRKMNCLHEYFGAVDPADINRGGA